MKCIYCLENSSDTSAAAHVLPEAVATNAMTLPLGTVCDGCNHYLGHELDSVLVAHPVVSAAIQTLHLRGKGGRLRSKVGNVDRTVAEGAITIPCAKPDRLPDGSLSIRPLIDPSFDFHRFRRALHHIAFNLLAYQDGAERACLPEFDAVRRYIKRPKPKEAWPFAQHISFAMTPEVTLGLNVVGECIVAAINLLSSAFFVSLGNHGRPEDALQSLLKTQPQVDYVDPAFNPHREPKQGSTRYRITIYVDGDP